jgi:uncharacterized protein with HEPN domain
MQPETLSLLEDVRRAAARIRQYVSGRTESDYCSDDLLRSAVERQFQIIGDALSHIDRFDAGFSQRITNCRRIVSFRNQLVHAYRTVRDDVVWLVIHNDLPTLEREVTELIASAAQT